MDFVGGQYGHRLDRKNYYLCAFWIIRMPSMVFDVILSVLGVLSRYVLCLLLFLSTVTGRTHLH